MRYIALFLVLFAAPLAQGQKNIYENNNFDHYAKEHKTLAIIPFITHLELKKQVDREDLEILAEKEGLAVQNALETYFGKRRERKRFRVEFQNIRNTNAILARNGIDYSNIDTFTTKELCGILEVDGLISGTLSLNILLSQGVPTNFNLFDYFSGNADYGRIGLKISDGKTGKLLWKYENEISKKTGRNTTELIERMMRTASRKFPYDRERRKKGKN